MASKKTKSILLSLSVVAASMTVSSIASAKTYWECVSVTYDPFACALNPNYDEWVVGFIANKEDPLEELSNLVASKELSHLEVLGKEVIAGRITQTCHPREYLSVVKSTKDPAVVKEACYRPAKPIVASRPSKERLHMKRIQGN